MADYRIRQPDWLEKKSRITVLTASIYFLSAADLVCSTLMICITAMDLIVRAPKASTMSIFLTTSLNFVRKNAAAEEALLFFPKKSLVFFSGFSIRRSLCDYELTIICKIQFPNWCPGFKRNGCLFFEYKFKVRVNSFLYM